MRISGSSSKEVWVNTESWLLWDCGHEPPTTSSLPTSNSRAFSTELVFCNTTLEVSKRKFEWTQTPLMNCPPPPPNLYNYSISSSVWSSLKNAWLLFTCEHNSPPSLNNHHNRAYKYNLFLTSKVVKDNTLRVKIFSVDKFANQIILGFLVT